MLEVDLKHFPSKLMKAGSIALVGNGGNLAVAQHMASDITRYTGKFCFAPDSVHLSAVGGDGDWKLSWMQYAKHADLIIGITCRKHSSTSDALMSIRHQCDTLLFAPQQHEVLDTIIVPAQTYHEFETNVLWQLYMILEHIGVVLPKLPHLS